MSEAGVMPPLSQGSRDWVSGRTLGLILFAGILMVLMALSSPNFLTQDTFVSLSRYVAFYILVALAQAVCLAVGDMNLAVGAMGSLATVALGELIAPNRLGWHPAVAVGLVVAIGLAAGLLHGVLIARMKIDSFVVTLSMMFVYMGIRSGVSRGNSYTIPESFLWPGQMLLGGWMYVMVLIVLGVVVAISYMYRHTVLGRRLLATGSNADAARLSGINTSRMVIIAHLLSGLFAVGAAILYACWQGNAAPQTGDDWLLVSFAAAIIGGTGLKGNLISPLGILMGALIFQLIKHALLVLNIDPNWSNVPLGALILLAIVVDRAREHVASKRKTL